MLELQATCGWLTNVFPFLGGLGAGCFCVVALIALATGERFESIVCRGAWVSALALSVGSAALLIGLGNPLRGATADSAACLSSWMTIVAWLLVAVLLNGLFASLWTGAALVWIGDHWRHLHEERALVRRILAAAGIPVNLGVAIVAVMLLLSIAPLPAFPDLF